MVNVHPVLYYAGLKLYCIIQFPEDDIRVIFINTYSNIARIILCEVRIGSCRHDEIIMKNVSYNNQYDRH